MIYVAQFYGYYPMATPEVEFSLNPHVPSPKLRLADEVEVKVRAYLWPEQFPGENLLPKLPFVEENRGKWGKIQRQFLLELMMERFFGLGVPGRDLALLRGIFREGHSDHLEIGFLEIQTISKDLWVCSPNRMINYFEDVIGRRNRQIRTLRKKLTELSRA